MSLQRSVSTPARSLLPSPLEKTPPTARTKRALTELSINVPPRPQSAHPFTTPEHLGQSKKIKKVLEPSSAPHSASSFASSGSVRDSPTDDSVWGPDVEAAFMDAIKAIPKLGRRKINIGAKPCGRNELIADYIYRRTGKIRTRKQVSSHIQVLKHIKRDDTDFLQLVADGKENDTDELLSRYDTIKPDIPVRQISSEINFSNTTLSSQIPSQTAKTQLKLEEFCIWATKHDTKNATDSISHVYSQLGDNEHVPEASIDAIKDWALRFPCLPALVASQSITPCPVFHMRSLLSLPETLDLDGEQQVVLRTQLAMSCMPHRAREQWACHTRVYTMGTEVLSLKQKVNMEHAASLGTVSAARRKAGSKVAIPFATDFWAAFLAGLASVDARTMSGVNETQKAEKRDRDATSAINSITLVQEIMTLETGLEASRRIMILVWEFDRAQTEADAHTYATQLILQEDTRQQMQQHLLSRSMPQTSHFPMQPSRPHPGNLQRSHSMMSQASYSTQSQYDHGFMDDREQSLSQQSYCQPTIPEQHAADLYSYNSTQQNNALGLQFLQGRPSTAAMARSYSAPTWTDNNAPTQYPDTLPWQDASFDWTVPDSAGYLQTSLEIPSDDFFVASPSRPQSTMPLSFDEGQIADDNSMPRLGFFPLAY